MNKSSFNSGGYSGSSNNKRRWSVKKRGCDLCLQLVNYISFRNTHLLNRLVNFQGHILPARLTGTCARHQRLISLAIKRARFMALMPYSKPRVKVQRQIVLNNEQGVVVEGGAQA